MTYTKRFFEILKEVDEATLIREDNPVDREMDFTIQRRIDITLKLLEEENKDKRMQMINEEKKERKPYLNRSNPATDKQIEMLKKLKIPYSSTILKEQASRLIEEKLGKKK